MRRSQLIQQLVGGLCGADFRGVDAAADGHDDFVGGGNLMRLGGRERARIGEPLILAADLIQIADVLGRRDDRGDGSVPVSRRSEVGDLHAIGAGGDELEIPLDVCRGREASVGAHAKAEMRFGSWNAIGLLLGASRGIGQ